MVTNSNSTTKGNKYFLNNDSPTNIDTVAWSIRTHPNNTSGEFLIRKDNKTIALHSDGYNKDQLLHKLKSKLTLIVACIDDFESMVIDYKGSPKAIRHWLNPTTGNEAEFTGSLCTYYSKEDAYLELSSCDRSCRFWYSPGQDTLKSNHRTIKELALIKTALLECIGAINIL